MKYSLSICINVKNRSLWHYNGKNNYLFPNCIDSLQRNVPKHLRKSTEIVIADWESDDWPIRDWIDDRTDLKVHILNITGKEFNRGMGRNIAFEFAEGQDIFFLDADMIVPPGMIDRCVKQLKPKTAVFPVVDYVSNPATGEKKTFAGFGNVFVHRYHDGGGFEFEWPEYPAYGWEDVAMYEQMRDNGYNIIFDPAPGFIHQWHPLIDDKENLDDKTRKEFEQITARYKQKADQEDEALVKQVIGILNNTQNTTHGKIRRPPPRLG